MEIFNFITLDMKWRVEVNEPEPEKGWFPQVKKWGKYRAGQ